MPHSNEDSGVSQDVFLDLSGTGSGPWEIRRAQSAIVKLVEQGVFHGQILDLGSGIGDNAIYIASRVKNAHVTGIDFAPKAVEVASEKARRDGVNHVRFECISVLDDPATSVLKRHSFDVVLDAAVFHIFSNEERLHYMRYLEHLIKPGGLYILLSNSENETKQGGPRRLKKVELQDLFSSANGWTIESIQDSQYETQLTSMWGTHMVAYLSLIRRNKNVR